MSEEKRPLAGAMRAVKVIDEKLAVDVVKAVNGNPDVWWTKERAVEIIERESGLRDLVTAAEALVIGHENCRNFCLSGPGSLLEAALKRVREP